MELELVNYDIPSSWLICNFGDIFNILGGNQPPKSEFSNSPQPGYIRLLQIRDFESDKYPVYIKDSQKWRKCSDDDLLIARYGASLGRICTGKSGTYNVALVRVIFEKQFLDRSWVKCFLESQWFQAPLFLVSRSAQSGFNKNELFVRPVPLPPLKEQKRIVTKIEALQTRSTAVKEELEAIKPLLNQFRQSVLASAFRGDLTKDWRSQNPDVESAEVLLERIRIERRQRWEEAELEKMKAKGKALKNDKWKKKYKEPKPIDTNGFSELPDCWCWIQVHELAADKPRSTQSGPFGSNLLHSEFQDTGILAIGIDNVLDGHFSLGKEHRISLEKYKELEKYTARPLDILITVMATVGRCCVVPVNLETAIITKHVYRVSSDQELVSPYFFMKALKGSRVVLSQIDKKIRGQTRPGINGQILKQLIIPIPPLDEQKEIVSRIESLFKLADNIEQQYQQAEVDLETLNQSILAKAFRGELVPQDPNDEPASVLLERIREERERAKTTAKKSKTKTKKKKSSKKKDEQLGIPGM